MRISDWSSDVCSSDLRFLAVLLLDVVDDAFAVVLAKVDIEVGHGYPLGIQKALEQQVVAEGIQVGKDRKSVVEGKRVSVRVDNGGRRIIKEKKINNT